MKSRAGSHESAISHMKQQIRQLQSENKDRTHTFGSQSKQLTEKDSQLASINRQIAEHQRQVSELESAAPLLEDLNSTIQGLTLTKNSQECELLALQQEVPNTNDLLTSEQIRTRKSKEKARDLKEELKLAKEEVMRLRDLAKPYVPTKADPTDLLLAEFINHRRAPLKVPFIREDSGQYCFGSRKVAVKVENGSLVIRAAGGSMSIDEFINLCTDGELQKQAHYSNKMDHLIDQLASENPPSFESPAKGPSVV